MVTLRSGTLALAGVLLCLHAAPVCAQWRPEPLVSVQPLVAAERTPGPSAWSTVRQEARPSYTGMVAGGLLAGALGAGAGYLMSSGSSRDMGSDAAAAAGGAVVAMPLGVHLGNRGRGDVGLTWLAAAGAGAGMLLLGTAEVGSAEAFVLAAPAAALAAGTYVQGATTRPARRSYR